MQLSGMLTAMEVPFQPLYGEPGWTRRPWTTIHDDFHLEPLDDLCYEEIRLQDWVRDKHLLAETKAPYLQGMMSAVQINIGPRQVPWMIHQALLETSSHTAHLALDGSAKKSPMPIIDWSHFHTDEFDTYCVFLYTRQSSIFLDQSIDVLFRLHVLGEALKSSDFQRNVFAAIFARIHKGNTVLKQEQIQYVLEHTSRHSALRSFFLDLVGIWLYRGQARFTGGDTVLSEKSILLDSDLKGECMDGLLKAISARKNGCQEINLCIQDYLPSTAAPVWLDLQASGSNRRKETSPMMPGLEADTESRSEHSCSASRPHRYVLLGCKRNVTRPPSIRGMTEMVKVKVGPGNKVWQIHRLLLTRESTVAQAALTGAFKESEDQFITWPDIDARDFNIFVRYLYTGAVATGFLSSDQLLRLFVLADQSISSSFMLVIFRAIFDRLRGTVMLTPAQVSYIMNHTHGSSCLQRLCSDLVCYGLINGIYNFGDESTGPQLNVLPNELKTDFMSGVLRALRSGKGSFGELHRPYEYYWTKSPVEARDFEKDSVAVLIPDQEAE